MNIQAEGWELVRELGQGGFGLVRLYRKKDTDEYIAIKTLGCRNDMYDQSQKVWERWKQEVSIMYNKVDHNNVIRAIPVPTELDAGPGEFPVLGMEFCREGDLRKLLMRPEHCCGLRESYMRTLLTDVGNAIEYLHGIRIIHRDIKPENIVLDLIDQDKYIYKIIDLGYAKELDASSCCISHVGTQQYLAPELYGKQAYTRTVDYWSFGSVVFECITGKRPFLPEVIGYHWHGEISKKSPDDITAAYGAMGEVTFSKKLPEPNYLCRPLRNYLEQWLKLMLRWDAKSRGGGVKKLQDGSERPKCFCVLEQILEMKIFHVLYAKANRLLSFHVDETHKIETVHQAIETQIKIPVSKQILLNSNGSTFQMDQFAIEACQDSNSENSSVFLFCQAPSQDEIFKETKLPAPVEAIIKEPKTVLPLQRHKEAWKNAVYYCANENYDYKQLLKGQRAAMLALLHQVRHLTQLKTKLGEEMKKLTAHLEYFQMSLDYDLQQYKTNRSFIEDLNGTKTDIGVQWKGSSQETDDVDILRQQVAELDKYVSDSIKPVLEMQRGRREDLNKLETCEKDAKALYAKLKALKVGQETLDHIPMVRTVGECYSLRGELTKALHESIDKMMNSYPVLQQAMPQVQSLINEIHDKKTRLMKLQQQRQEDIWKMATCTLSFQNVNLMADQSMSLMSGVNNAMPSYHSMATSNMESVMLVEDSKFTIQRMDCLLDDMSRELDDSVEYFSASSSH